MTNIIKKSGWPFSYDTSNYHSIKPSKFEWHNGECDSSDVTVYFDLDHMGGFSNRGNGFKFLMDNFNNNKDRLRFLINGLNYNKDRLRFLLNGFSYNNSEHLSLQIVRHASKNELKFLWLSESRAITGKRYNHVLENADLFFEFYDAIFVHDREMIEKDNRFKYLPNGSNKHWIVDCGIHKKTKLVSMINSGKKMCKGHRARNEITSQINDKVDLFGLLYNPIERKETALNDYMFSIALENAQYETYFTEKILDCFATGTIPIYWGAPDIGDYFNEDGIIKWNENFDIEQLNKDLYFSKMDAIKDNFERCMNVISSEDLLYEEIIKFGL